MVGGIIPPQAFPPTAGAAVTRALWLSLMRGRIVSSLPRPSGGISFPPRGDLVTRGSQRPPVRAEDPRAGQSPARQTVQEGRAQHSQAVADAREEIDRGRLREVPAGTAHLADREPEVDRLAD